MRTSGRCEDPGPVRAPGSRPASWADARRLSPAGQEDLRRRVVAAVEAGSSQLAAARVFGVSRRAVGVWVRAHRTRGPDALRAHRRGRLPGEQCALGPREQAEVVRQLAAGPPARAGVDGLLWSRRAVADLVELRTGRRLSATTVGHYLTRWGLQGPAVPRGAAADAPPAVLLARLGAGVPAAPGAETVWLAWTRPAPRFAGCPLVPGPGAAAAGPDPLRPGPAPEDLHALVARPARGALLFALAAEPFGPAAVRDVGDRLARSLGHPVHAVVRGWPPQHAAVLGAWRADPGPRVRLTLA